MPDLTPETIQQLRAHASPERIEQHVQILCPASVMNALLDAAERERWVPVKERMPLNQEPILVTGETDGVRWFCTAKFFDVDDGEFRDGWGNRIRITHWRPIYGPQEAR